MTQRKSAGLAFLLFATVASAGCAIIVVALIVIEVMRTVVAHFERPIY